MSAGSAGGGQCNAKGSVDRSCQDPRFFIDSDACCKDPGVVIFKEVWELSCFSCGCMDEFTRRIETMFDRFHRKNCLQLGIALLQLLCSMPRWQGRIDSSTSSRRPRDVLPLPMSPMGSALKLLKGCHVTMEGFLIFREDGFQSPPKQQRRKAIHRGCLQVWRLIFTTIIHGQFFGVAGAVV